MDQYHLSHTGLDKGVPFYTVVKLTNKAGLSKLHTVGPMVIDDTPPRYLGGLETTIKGNHIVVSWNNNTFEETEQKEHMTSMLFRIGHDQRYVSPIHEAVIFRQCPLNMFACFKFPLNHIKSQDTGLGLSFHFELYVYNIAGHFATVKTDEFMVPSRFPPGVGKVFDIDPAYSNTEDIDFVREDGTICGKWTGFAHHRNVTIEVAIGTNNDIGDVVAFHKLIEPVGFTCLLNVSLDNFRTYFFLVRAKCSGGVSISASDGFTVVNHTHIRELFTVNNGRACQITANEVSKININKKGLDTHVIGTAIFNNSNILQQYSLNAKCSIDNLAAIIIRNRTVSHRKLDNTFIIDNLQLITTQEEFRFTFTDSRDSQCNVTIYGCSNDIEYQYVTNSYSLHIDYVAKEINLATHYEVGLAKLPDTSVTHNITEEDLIVPFARMMKTDSLTLPDLILRNGNTYVGMVNLCFGHGCVATKYSQPIRVNTENPEGHINSAVLTSETNGVNLSFTMIPFKCNKETVKVYRWALKDEKSNSYLTKWKPFIHTAHNAKEINIDSDQSIPLPMYRHRRVLICVNAICSSGLSNIECINIQPSQVTSEFDKKHLYELDSADVDVRTLRQLMYASYIGDSLKDLHSSEIDFCSSNIKLVGAILNSADRPIQWFLMKNNSIPVDICEDSDACVESSLSDGGVGLFKRHTLITNVKYFICARADKFVLHHETTDEVMPRLHLCGNGFYVDNEPPVGGSVSISSGVRGYITSSNEVHVEWSGFTDIEQHVRLENYEGITEYHVALGHTPTGQEEQLFMNVGRQTTLVMRNLSLTSGTMVYVSVKAIDNVGLSTIVSSDPVIVDTTEPTLGWLQVGNEVDSYYMAGQVHVSWGGFDDEESGVMSFEVGVGSSPFSANIVSMHQIEGQSATLVLSNLTEGYIHYVILKVTNNAGLSSITSSLPFSIDNSPPEGGFVHDGTSSEVTGDKDFQLNTTCLQSNWYGFQDEHSGILYYEVGVGTDPFVAGVVHMKHTGLDIAHTWCDVFSPGVKYFTIVRACNGANLCTMVSSDGVIMDKSEPIPGIIHVGGSDRHQTFVGHNESLPIKWIGFQDPQSGIKSFEWCLGKIKQSCDIVDFQNAHLSNSVLVTRTHLPINTDLFVSLRATNNAHLFTIRSSEKFSIDITPPIVLKQPKFVLQSMGLSETNNSQWENSVIRLEWLFDDIESAVASHSVAFKIHQNGRTVLEEMTCGSENKMTLRFNKDELLRDGDSYTAWVTACNPAGLCTTDTSDVLLVDSTPPHLGGFTRNMNWFKTSHLGVNSTALHVEWFGLADLESGIKSYTIMASCSFSGSELTNGTVDVQNTNSNRTESLVYLPEHIPCKSDMVLSIMATNTVGLRSKVAKTTVSVVSTSKSNSRGFLVQLTRHSCTSHYCTNDCTCSVIGHKCDHARMPCVDQSGNTTRKMTITFGHEHSNTSRLSLSSKCLNMHWAFDGYDDKNIVRYEWSISEEGGNPGEGIFNIPYEPAWYDNGRLLSVVHCITNGHHALKDGQKYIAHVRAWYGFDVYEMFTSEPILIDHSPPQIVRGRNVVESTRSSCGEDVEQTPYSDIMICWDGVFLDRGSGILHYNIMGGTAPFGNDFLKMVNVGLNATFGINGAEFHPGTKYFFTVMATNGVGMMTSSSSDGIVVDTDTPVAGEAYNTVLFRDIQTSSSSSTFEVSWQGFDDYHSYIMEYLVEVVDTSRNRTVVNETTQGMMSNIQLTGLTLKHGSYYRAHVRAVDSVGHSSTISKSKTVLIDTTPPQIYKCHQFETKMPSALQFTNNGNEYLSFKLENISLKLNGWYRISTTFKGTSNLRIATLVIGTSKLSLYLAKNADDSLSSEYEFRHEDSIDNKTNIILLVPAHFENIIAQLTIAECVNTSSSSDGQVVVHQVGPSAVSLKYFIFDDESGIKDILVGVGTTKTGYQMRGLSPLSKHRHTIVTINATHGSPVYITCIGINYAGARSVFRSNQIVIDKTSPHVDLVSSRIRRREVTTVKQVELSLNDNATLTLNTTQLENTTISNDDMANETTNETFTKTFTDVELQFGVEDHESGVYSCECMIRHLNQPNNSVEWGVAFNNTFCAIENINVTHGDKIETKLKCTNNVQLESSVVSSFLTVSFTPPGSNGGDIQLIPNDVTKCHLGSICNITQSRDQPIDFVWSPIEDSSGIAHYEIRTNNNPHWQTTGMRRYVQIETTGVNNQDNLLVTELRGVNSGNLTSEVRNISIHLANIKPTLTGQKASVTGTRSSRELSWCNVFDHPESGRYSFEVSIGTISGFADIQKPYKTTDCKLPVDIPSGTTEVYTVVHCYGNSPDFGIYRDVLLV